MKKPFRISTLAATAALGLMLGSASQAAMVTWDFNLPSTSVASQTPPYPSTATLTLQDSVDGVIFTLDPNEANPGYDLSIPSTVDALNIAYQGADLSSSAYQWLSGPVANAETFGNAIDPLVAIVAPPNNALNLDTNYSVPAADGNGQLKLTWNNPDFPVDDVSMWIILGTTIADNFSLMATSNSHPTPTFGIFSVSSISLTDPNPTPSNWVTGPSPVPVPAAIWLFGSALIGFVGISRRTSIRS